MGWDPIGDIVDTYQNYVANPVTEAYQSTIGNAIGQAWAQTGIGNVFDPNNPYNLANLGVNYMTGGLVGYDGRGFNPQAGWATNLLDESIGEITGRNLARESLYQAGQLTAREDARRSQLLADQRTRAAQEDRAASDQAMASRLGSRGALLSRGGLPLIMGDTGQGDLLGL